jgi:hypothetical protein
MGKLIKKLAKIGAGALAVGAIFYLAGGAAAQIGLAGITADLMGAFGLIVGIAYGMADAIE